MLRSGGIFDYDRKRDRLAEVTLELAAPDIWSIPERAQALGHERASLAAQIEQLDVLAAEVEECREFLELAEGDADAEMFAEAVRGVERIGARLAQLEFLRMFTHAEDSNNAYMEIQSGAGGTDAQDWAEMLVRMYVRWAERHGFDVQINESVPGDVDGIRRATLHFAGEYAHGWLRTEAGVHRLVRRSPYKSDNSRQTSFAKVMVYAEIDDSIEINLDMTDVRVDTYRASGAGGQHVNKTDSAVRLTHLPTGIVVQCQNQRSQHKNRSQAFQQLRGRLYELELEQRSDARRKQRDQSPDIGWGSQIRSYVLDQPRVKDHRTGVEVSNPGAVLDGELDAFIEVSLKSGI